MIAHHQSTIITECVKRLDREHGKHGPLKITREKIHEYLGMTVDFSLSRGGTISQHDFAKKLHKELPLDLRETFRKTLALGNVFKVDDEAMILGKDKRESYHSVTQKCVWLSQRSRPDLQLATGCHCTRVAVANTSD